jgi:hypothetical protein
MSDDEDYEDEKDSEPMLLMMGEDGKLGFAPNMVQIPESDFELLQKGLELLAKKYPAIHKECFVQDETPQMSGNKEKV